LCQNIFSSGSRGAKIDSTSSDCYLEYGKAPQFLGIFSLYFYDFMVLMCGLFLGFFRIFEIFFFGIVCDFLDFFGFLWNFVIFDN
jgi:hypothetical protein